MSSDMNDYLIHQGLELYFMPVLELQVISVLVNARPKLGLDLYQIDFTSSRSASSLEPLIRRPCSTERRAALLLSLQ